MGVQNPCLHPQDARSRSKHGRHMLECEVRTCHLGFQKAGEPAPLPSGHWCLGGGHRVSLLPNEYSFSRSLGRFNCTCDSVGWLCWSTELRERGAWEADRPALRLSSHGTQDTELQSTPLSGRAPSDPASVARVRGADCREALGLPRPEAGLSGAGSFPTS